MPHSALHSTVPRSPLVLSPYRILTKTVSCHTLYNLTVRGSVQFSVLHITNIKGGAKVETDSRGLLGEGIIQTNGTMSDGIKPDT